MIPKRRCTRRGWRHPSSSPSPAQRPTRRTRRARRAHPRSCERTSIGHERCVRFHAHLRVVAQRSHRTPRKRRPRSRRRCVPNPCAWRRSHRRRAREAVARCRSHATHSTTTCRHTHQCVSRDHTFTTSVVNEWRRAHARRASRQAPPGVTRPRSIDARVHRRRHRSRARSIDRSIDHTPTRDRSPSSPHRPRRGPRSGDDAVRGCWIAIPSPITTTGDETHSGGAGRSSHSVHARSGSEAMGVCTHACGVCGVVFKPMRVLCR